MTDHFKAKLNIGNAEFRLVPCSHDGSISIAVEVQDPSDPPPGFLFRLSAEESKMLADMIMGIRAVADTMRPLRK